MHEHPTCNNGPIANPLGSLATVLGRFDDAESYLSEGTELTARGHLKYAEAHVELGWGRMLAARRRPGDPQRSREHLSRAKGLARDHDYAMVARKVEEELASLPAS